METNFNHEQTIIFLTKLEQIHNKKARARLQKLFHELTDFDDLMKEVEFSLKFCNTLNAA
jgi:hypothetical protein